MNVWQQWEQLKLIAREHKLDADNDFNRFWIGRKRYHNPIDASCALLHAFDLVGIKVPDELRQRPIDLT